MTNNIININTVNLINAKTLTARMLTSASREIQLNANEMIDAIMEDYRLNKDDATNVLITEYKKLQDIVTMIFNCEENKDSYKLIKTIKNKYRKLTMIIQDIIVDDFKTICKIITLYTQKHNK